MARTRTQRPQTIKFYCSETFLRCVDISREDRIAFLSGEVTRGVIMVGNDEKMKVKDF